MQVAFNWYNLLWTIINWVEKMDEQFIRHGSLNSPHASLLASIGNAQVQKQHTYIILKTYFYWRLLNMFHLSKKCFQKVDRLF